VLDLPIPQQDALTEQKGRRPYFGWALLLLKVGWSNSVRPDQQQEALVFPYSREGRKVGGR